MDGFKQRIIGALIIVGLAIIFLPMMFDEPHEERTRQTIDIPEQPDFPEVRVDRPQRPDSDPDMTPVDPPEAPPEPSSSPEPAQQAVDEPEAPDPAPVSAPEAEPEPEPEKPDSAALKGSYLVQLGSFGSSDNARQLRDRTREAGIQAYTEELTREGEPFTRVFAGPFMSRSDAESAKADLDERFSLDTLVISAGKED